MMPSAQQTLGITCTCSPSSPSFERGYFYKLSTAAQKYDLNVIVFNPSQIDWQKRTVPAWRVNKQKRWTSHIAPLPALIYDRCFYQDAHHYRQYKSAVTRLYRDPQTRWLGRPLQGKYHTYLLLSTHEVITSFLPETRRYTDTDDLRTMMQRYGSVCLKPNGGSHGRGVIAIHPQSQHTYSLRGRDRQNRAFHAQLRGQAEVLKWCQRFIGNTRYIIQPYLTLTTSDGIPFDLRLLMQKDQHKQWSVTGSAIRIGHPRSITSNLHGGGKAVPWESFCQKKIPAEHRRKIVDQIKQCIHLVPSYIEAQHGRLVELGIDLGIDHQGRVWLLEANSKPGRSVFLQTGDRKRYQLAIEQPLRYAQALLRETKEVSP